jgi:hypothetical protein
MKNALILVVPKSIRFENYLQYNSLILSIKSYRFFSNLFLFYYCLLGLTAQVSAQTPTQELQVLMIGASHEYSPTPKQDLSGIHAKIRAFKPDAFFGEWLSSEDEKAIKTYWNKKNVLKRDERLRARKKISEAELPIEIARLEKIVAQNPDDMKARVDLAVVNYLNFDSGNGYHQMWHVAKYLEKNPKETQLFDYAYKQFLPVKMDTLQEMINNYINDEYDYIAFPMMKELKQKTIYPMDSQRWDNEWSKAWTDADSVFWGKMEEYKKDSTSVIGLKVKELRAKVKQRMKYLEEDASKVYGETHGTEALNGPQMTEWLFRINFYADEYRELPFFPADLYGLMTHWWWHRNNDMCQNTISRSKANGFKKVVIVVGANHAAWMTKIFTENGIKVTNINDAAAK